MAELTYWDIAADEIKPVDQAHLDTLNACHRAFGELMTALPVLRELCLLIAQGKIDNRLCIERAIKDLIEEHRL